jgi:hypothetical protein
MSASLNNLRKLNGQLVQTSSEELQNLASSAERSATPSTPLEAGAIGGNADQAKMAGSSANKLQALRQSIRAESDLQTASKRQADRTSRTAEEQARAEQEGLLTGSLGSLDTRVQEIAAKVFAPQPAEAMQGPTGLGINSAALATAVKDPAGQARATELATKLGQGTVSPGELVELAGLVGISDSSIGPDQLAKTLKELFLTDAASLGQAAASQVQDDITLGQALSPDELAQVAEAMGIAPADLQSMNTAGFEGAIRKFQADRGFNNLEDLQRRAADPFSSPADRELARRQLREMGSTGMRTVERAMDAVLEQASSATTVNMGGTEMKVSEMLNDQSIAANVKLFLEGTDEDRAKLTGQFGQDFANWVTENQEALKAATAKIDTAVTDLAKLQTANRELADLGPNAGRLDDGVMKVFYPEWGKLTANQLQPVPLLNTLKELGARSPSLASQITAGLSALAREGYAEDLQALAGMDAIQLHRAGLTSPGAFDNFIRYRKAVDDLQKYPAGEALEMLFMENQDLLNSLLSDAQAVRASGIGALGSNSILRLLDRNGDGKIEADDQTRQALLKLLGGDSSLSELLQSGKNVSQLANPVALLQGEKVRLDEQLAKNPLLARLKDFYRGDGKLTPGEAGSVADDMDISELEQWLEQGQGSFEPGVESTLRRQLNIRTRKGMVDDARALGVDIVKLDGLLDRAGNMQPATVQELTAGVGALEQLIARTPEGLRKTEMQETLKRWQEALKKDGADKKAAADAKAADAKRKKDEDSVRANLPALIDAAYRPGNPPDVVNRAQKQLAKVIEKYPELWAEFQPLVQKTQRGIGGGSK